MTAPVQPAGDTAGSHAKVTITADPVNGTEYVVLARDEDGNYSYEETVTARTPDAAIRKSAESAKEQPDAWVAIPARSWKPVKVTPQTVTTLKLEEAK